MSDLTDSGVREAIEELHGSLRAVAARVEGIDVLRDSFDDLTGRLDEVQRLAVQAASGARDKGGARMDEAVVELATVVRSLMLQFDTLRGSVERKEDDAAKLLAGVVDALHETAERLGALDRAVRAVAASPPAIGGVDEDALAPLRDEIARIGAAIAGLAPKVDEVSSIQRALGDLGAGLRRIEETASALGAAQIALAGRTEEALSVAPAAAEPVDLVPVAERLEASIERSAGSLARGVEWLHDELRQAFDVAIGSRTAPLQRTVDLIRDELIIRLEPGTGGGDAAAETAARLLASLREDTERITTALGSLRTEQDELTGDLRKIGESQQQASRDVGALAAALEASEGALERVGEQMAALRERVGQPVVAPEIRDALLRIEAALADTRAAMASIGERMPDLDPSAIGDVLAGLTYVATKIDEVARSQPAADLAAHLETSLAPLGSVRDELTEIRARIDGAAQAAATRSEATASALADGVEALARTVDAGTLGVTKAVEGWAGESRATSAELFAALEAVRSAIQSDTDRGALVAGLDAALAAADELRAGVGGLTASLAEATSRSSRELHDVRERISETTGHVARALETLSQIIGAAREEVPGAIDATASRVAAEVMSEFATLRGSFVDVRSRLEDALARAQALEEDHAGVGSALQFAGSAITVVAERAEELSALVGPGLSDLREHIAAFQAEMRAAFTTVRDDVGGAVQRARTLTGSDLDGLKADLGAARETLGAFAARVEEFASVMPVLSSLDARAASVDLRLGEIEALGPATDAIRTQIERIAAVVEQTSSVIEQARTQAASDLRDGVAALATEVQAGFEGVRADVGRSAEAVRSAAEQVRASVDASQGALDAVRVQIEQALGAQRGAVSGALSEQMANLSSALETQRAALDHALEVANAATLSALEAQRTETAGALESQRAAVATSIESGHAALTETVERSSANVSASLARSMEVVHDAVATVTGTVDAVAAELRAGTDVAQARIDETLAHTREELVAALGATQGRLTQAFDATASDLLSHVVAVREDVRSGIADVATITSSLPELVQPAADEIARVAQGLERAVDLSVTSLRDAADEGAAHVARTLEEATARSDERLRALGEAVHAVVERVDAQEEAVTGEIGRMGEEIPRLAETVAAAIGAVAETGGDLDRRAGDFVTLASDALAQFAEEVSASLAAGRADLDGAIGGAIADLTGRLEQQSAAAAADNAAAREAIETRIEALATSLEERLYAMHEQMATTLQALTDDAGARLDELVSSAASRIDETLAQIPTTDEVTTILHERAAGALRSVRRRLVRMDDVLSTLASAEGSMHALADRVAALENDISRLPSAGDVAEVLLSSKRGLLRRRAVVPAAPVSSATTADLQRSRPGRPEPASPVTDRPEAEQRFASDVSLHDEQDEQILSLDLGLEPVSDEPDVVGSTADDGFSAEDELFLAEALEPDSHAPARPPKGKAKTKTTATSTAKAKASGKRPTKAASKAKAPTRRR